MLFYFLFYNKKNNKNQKGKLPKSTRPQPPSPANLTQLQAQVLQLNSSMKLGSDFCFHSQQTQTLIRAYKSE
jgi:hypothetical protein